MSIIIQFETPNEAVTPWAVRRNAESLPECDCPPEHHPSCPRWRDPEFPPE